jgi:hypothetical protein
MPFPTLNQTGMATKMGNVPMLDSNGMLVNALITPKIVAKTASYTCKASESGTVFLTTGATAAVTFTLPVASDGPWVFWFINTVDQNMLVATAVADTMITFNDVAADSVAFSTSSEKIGGFAIAICDGTSIAVVTPIIAHSQTVTIATA